MEEAASDEILGQGKKRQRKPETWKQNVRKSKKLKGEEYTNCKGKVVNKKSIVIPVCNCNKKCYSRFTESNQNQILSNFLQLTTKNEQDLHLQRLIEAFPIKRRRGKSETRNASFKFFVLLGNARINVCRKAFINLHVTTQKRVFRLCTLLMQGVTPQDKRGFNVKSHGIPGDVCKLIYDHIKSFPTKKTHYGSSPVEYLDARLNVRIMYQLFLSKYSDTNVKYSFYLQYFNENFKLCFGRPQIDVCSKCEELEVKLKNPHLLQSVKRATQSELEVHKRRSKKFYNELKKARELCKSDNSVCGLVFDYMQNLPLPAIPVQEIFYMRQIWVYAFCITNLRDNSSRVYVYSEGEAKKGANEVSSFLYDYIRECVPESANKLLLFSDSCPGQNRNHTFIRFCLGLVESKRFDSITHRFPIRGHSFLDCDRTFGKFKSCISKVDRIYHPMEYVELIVNSKSNVTAKTIQAKNIYNFNAWWPQLYKKTCLSIESYASSVPRQLKQSFTPSSFREFTYLSSGLLEVSPFIRGLEKHTFNLRKPGVRPNSAEMFGKLLPAYVEGKVPINQHKVEAIRNLMQYVSEADERSQAYYKAYLEWPTTSIDD